MTDNITIPSSASSAAVSAASVRVQPSVQQPVQQIDVTTNDQSQDFARTNPPFVSPAIRLDYSTQQVVLEFRNSENGEVERQIEPNSRIEAYTPPTSSDRAESVDIEISSRSSNSEVSNASAASQQAVNTQDVSVTESAGNNSAAASSTSTVDPQTPLASGDTSSFA